MNELIKTGEVIGNVLKVAKHVGEYVMETVKGGGWANLGKTTEEPPTPANITFRREDDGEF